MGKSKMTIMTFPSRHTEEKLMEPSKLFNKMMTLNGNIFRVTGLCARNSPLNSLQNPVTWRFDVSVNCALVNNREVGDLRCHRAHSDVTVMRPTHLFMRRKMR